MNKRRFTLSTTQIIMFSFLLAILVGTLLLWLPISTAEGNRVAFTDALFPATSAPCVTGLVTVPTVTTWSVFGQIVILCLIQIGGLGIITVTAGFMLMLHRKFALKDRILLQDAFNLSSLSGLGSFVKKVMFGTFLVEGAGALLYMLVFVPRFGAKGIWVSIFTAISAFCNAGIDIVGTNSLAEYATHPLINLVTATLIILGGIGYIVWWDVLRVLRSPRGQKRFLTLHSKIALSASAILIFGGALVIFCLEYSNPQTLAPLSLFDKIQASLFQSVTTRTAGFFTLPQQNLSNATALFCMLLMFIGGSPVGTAGGVKTVTVAILVASVVSVVKNKQETALFHRSVSRETVTKAMAVVGVSFAILFASTLFLLAATDASALDILYETVSATATVGLSRDLTASLTTLGKLIITATMYLGRVGPISLAFVFQSKKQQQNIIKNPAEDIRVG